MLLFCWIKTKSESFVKMERRLWKEQTQEVLFPSAMSPSEKYKDRYKEHGMLVIKLLFFFPFGQINLYSIHVVAKISKRN